MMFSTQSKTNSITLITLELTSANSLNLDKSYMLSCDKESPLFNSFPNDKNFRLFHTERLQKTISNLTKMAENYRNRKKTLLVKEKLLVASNFSCSLRAISPFPTVFSKDL